MWLSRVRGPWLSSVTAFLSPGTPGAISSRRLRRPGSTWSHPTCVDAIASYRWEEMQATLELNLPNYATDILSAADTIAALEHTTV
jgi:hypothetical protein